MVLLIFSLNNAFYEHKDNVMYVYVQFLFVSWNYTFCFVLFAFVVFSCVLYFLKSIVLVFNCKFLSSSCYYISNYLDSFVFVFYTLFIKNIDSHFSYVYSLLVVFILFIGSEIKCLWTSIFFLHLQFPFSYHSIILLPYL